MHLYRWVESELVAMRHLESQLNLCEGWPKVFLPAVRPSASLWRRFFRARGNTHTHKTRTPQHNSVKQVSMKTVERPSNTQLWNVFRRVSLHQIAAIQRLKGMSSTHKQLPGNAALDESGYSSTACLHFARLSCSFRANQSYTSETHIPNSVSWCCREFCETYFGRCSAGAESSSHLYWACARISTKLTKTTSHAIKPSSFLSRLLREAFARARGVCIIVYVRTDCRINLQTTPNNQNNPPYETITASRTNCSCLQP